MSDYIDGYNHGYLTGLQTGQELATADLERRDEHLARRIVALLLQHDYNQQLVDSIIRTNPYDQRGTPRRNDTTAIDWRELLGEPA